MAPKTRDPQFLGDGDASPQACRGEAPCGRMSRWSYYSRRMSPLFVTSQTSVGSFWHC